MRIALAMAIAFALITGVVFAVDKAISMKAVRRDFAMSQAPLITSEGVFQCVPAHTGVTIMSEIACGSYTKVSPLPDGVEAIIILPKGTKSIIL